MGPKVMIYLTKGKYRAREAKTPSDLRAAQLLRARCFSLNTSLDADAFDAQSTHILIEDTASSVLVCCYRLLILDGGSLKNCYAAQYYELSALESYDGLMLELGRFCVSPEHRDPDILRLAWAAMTDYVDREGVRLLFGCSSFAGVKTEDYLDAFAMLRARHLAPKRWLPRVKAPDVFRFAARLRRKPDAKKAMLRMPPLLRTYLLMGGWVSDHAVVDHQMNTLHVFTGLEIGAIPDSRKRLLRAMV
ncbi:GNAT family N-acetyltransferase [Sulfitobacter sp. JBTF-M27]|uniref:L-ornithine N(alpha)-acyltransferase n=1 Tax=Sulfitobacter sediminilitoris TaxID=2698830 RepID=A0A6P0C963_9RHOB|nr:GNAT family N-acyltransferase [Sulfitobacter sediminilitoris]NEK20894.1 GNAT family N-acetyltransferase [Sulfitobacter sediminilitoris]